MNTLSTVVMALFSLLNLLLLFATNQERRAAQAEAHALRTSRGRIIALEAAYEGLHAQHRKLSGRFYASAANRDAEYTRTREEQQVDFVRHQHAPGDCDNYRLAQIEGPGSKAAKCECTFCEHMRAQRRALRATLPVNHAAAVKAIDAAS